MQRLLPAPLAWLRLPTPHKLKDMAIYIPFAPGFNLPPYWLNRPVTVLGHEDADGADAGMSWVKRIKGEYEDNENIIKGKYLGNLYQAPLSVKLESEAEWWMLPFDPVISVTGKNIIIRRNVLKADSNRRGSIKEIWSQDDYEINIAGVLIGEDGKRPEANVCNGEPIYCNCTRFARDFFNFCRENNRLLRTACPRNTPYTTSYFTVHIHITLYVYLTLLCVTHPRC